MFTSLTIIVRSLLLYLKYTEADFLELARIARETAAKVARVDMALVARAEHVAVQYDKAEQSLFKNLQGVGGQRGYSAICDEPEVQPHPHSQPQAEPQEDSGGFFDEPLREENSAVSRKKKKRHKVQSIPEPVPGPDVDDWGDMLDVVRFRWSETEPEFLVRWSKIGLIANPADLVLLDMPDECLKILWTSYRKDTVVMAWIKGLSLMKRAIKGWKDIK